MQCVVCHKPLISRQPRDRESYWGHDECLAGIDGIDWGHPQPATLKGYWAKEGASMHSGTFHNPSRVTQVARDAIRAVLDKRREYDRLGEQQLAINEKLSAVSRQEDAALDAVAKALPAPPDQGVCCRYVLVDGELFQLMYRKYASEKGPAVSLTQLPLES